MRITYHLVGDTTPIYFQSKEPIIRIGSDRSVNDIVLQSGYVADSHAVLQEKRGEWELSPLSDNPVVVGKQKIRMGERIILGRTESVEIFPFTLKCEYSGGGGGDDQSLDDQISELVLAIHHELLSRLDVSDTDDSRRQSDEFLLQLEQDIDELARLNGLDDEERQVLRIRAAALRTQSHLLQGIIEGAIDDKPRGERWTQMLTSNPDYEGKLKELSQSIESTLTPERNADLTQRIGAIEQRFFEVWDSELVNRNMMDSSNPLLRYLAHSYVKKQVKDIVFGYGPLEDLIQMPNISEIMVVSQDKIYVEKNGVLEKSGRRFVSDSVTVSIIERIVNHVNRRINTAEPLVDARLRDGSRVNAVISPLALSGPCLTIRKFPLKKLTIDDLVKKGAITPVVREFLRACVHVGCNILISGGTGTGKTTMLNCLSDFIPDKNRIVTIEDTAELQLKKEHVVRLETKSANLEGEGEYTIRDLVINSLRMRPDRIVVGECRGPEALDMLQAMNTGHDGSMTTIHANTAEDVVQRLEVLVQQAADLPVASIHSQIGSAIDLVIQLKRMGKRRCVSQVTEFVGYDKQSQKLRTKDLFLLDSHAEDALLSPTGSLPTFMGKLIETKLLDLQTFYL